MGQVRKKYAMSSQAATVRIKTAKDKLDRFRALARERRHESWGDVEEMNQQDQVVYEAFRDARDRANRKKK